MKMIILGTALASVFGTAAVLVPTTLLIQKKINNNNDETHYKPKYFTKEALKFNEQVSRIFDYVKGELTNKVTFLKSLIGTPYANGTLGVVATIEVIPGQVKRLKLIFPNWHSPKDIFDATKRISIEVIKGLAAECKENTEYGDSESFEKIKRAKTKALFAILQSNNVKVIATLMSTDDVTSVRGELEDAMNEYINKILDKAKQEFEGIKIELKMLGATSSFHYIYPPTYTEILPINYLSLKIIKEYIIRKRDVQKKAKFYNDELRKFLNP